MSLERGQKIKIANIVTGNKLSIEISAYDNHGLIYDMSVFGLDVSGKCSDEDSWYFVVVRAMMKRRSVCCGGGKWENM